MFILALLLGALLCLAFPSTRVAGLIVLIVLCLLHPVLLVVLMTIVLGIYLFHRSKPKNHPTFLPKE